MQQRVSDDCAQRVWIVQETWDSRGRHFETMMQPGGRSVQEDDVCKHDTSDMNCSDTCGVARHPH